MPFDMRYLAEEPADETPTDWASMLFFGGTVFGVMNWATMSVLRDTTALKYFDKLPEDPIDKAKVVTMLANIGMMMGVTVMLTMAIFCHGPPSTELMYSAGFMHLMFFIDQTVGLAKGNMKALQMPTKPIIFWAVVNFCWTVASFWAAASDSYPIDYPEGKTVFGWPWKTLFYITCCTIVGVNAIKTCTISFNNNEDSEGTADEDAGDKQPLQPKAAT